MQFNPNYIVNTATSPSLYLSLLYLAGLAIPLASYLFSLRFTRDNMTCRCGYSLAGLSLTSRCPECGEAVRGRKTRKFELALRQTNAASPLLLSVSACIAILFVIFGKHIAIEVLVLDYIADGFAGDAARTAIPKREMLPNADGFIYNPDRFMLYTLFPLWLMPLAGRALHLTPLAPRRMWQVFAAATLASAVWVLARAVLL